ncbi:MAG: hypothetical protein ACRD3P_17695 [Terriglobales bacterium]
MRFFTKQHEVQVPEPSLAERLEDAERRVHEADEEAKRVAKQLYDLQCQHKLTLNNFSQIEWCGEIGGTTETDLAQRVRELVVKRSDSLQQFHNALNVWAGLKGALECR